MGNNRTEETSQAILNLATDFTVAPPLLQVGIREWNGTAWVKKGGGGAGTSGVKALSSATIAVAVTAGATACDYVDLSADGGVIAVGDSSVQSVDGTSQGVQLFPGGSPYRVYISDLANLYAAGASGSRLCYNYY